jgi:hypothetical protein
VVGVRDCLWAELGGEGGVVGGELSVGGDRAGRIIVAELAEQRAPVMGQTCGGRVARNTSVGNHEDAADPDRRGGGPVRISTRPDPIPTLTKE